MDEQLLRKVSRQLRFIQITLGFFGALILLTLAATGYMIYKVVTFTNNIENRITNFQTETRETLDIKKQLCESKTLTSFLDRTDYCKE
jgi:hypothetical protein